MSSSQTFISQFNCCPSRIKIELATVIENIKTLKAHESGHKVLTAIELFELKTQIELLLDQVEKVPFEKLRKKLVKRKFLRKRLKLKKRNLLNKQKIDSTSQANINKSKEDKSSHTMGEHINYTYEPFCLAETLKILHEEQPFCAKETPYTIANEMLQNQFKKNKKRSGKYQLLSEKSAQTPKVEHQWDEIFFGNRETPSYGSKLAVNDFINIRHTWDTYLTHREIHGTSIPIGWVLPKKDVADAWKEYRRSSFE